MANRCRKTAPASPHGIAPDVTVVTARPAPLRLCRAGSPVERGKSEGRFRSAATIPASGRCGIYSATQL
jgi:hypothetical protein